MNINGPSVSLKDLQADTIVVGRPGHGRPSASIEALLPEILALVSCWAQQQDHLIQTTGVPLSTQGLEDARKMGVQAPERVRLLKVDAIPMPEHPNLQAAATATGLISPLTSGMTLNHSIFIRQDQWRNRRLLAHELVHVGQYEQAGSLQAFLTQYLRECVEVGYADSPLEKEAVILASCIPDLIARIE